MRRSAPLVLAAALLLGSAGCVPFWRKADESEAERILGTAGKKGRFRKTTAEDLDRDMARSKDGLALRIRTHKTVYARNELILLDVRLINATGRRRGEKTRDIPVYFELLARGPRGTDVPWLLRFELREEREERVIFRSADLEVPKKDREKYHHFVNLPPRAYVGRQFTFPASMLKPGREYSFVVSYVVDATLPYVIINPGFSREQVDLLGIKLAYVRVWTGTVHSNRASFRMRRKRFLGIF